MAAARGVVSGARALDHVRAIAAHHRIQSTPGYDDAAAWLAQRLGAAGLPVTVTRVAADGRTRHRDALLQQGWHCDRGVAILHGPSSAAVLCDFAAEPLAVVQRSTAAAGRHPLVAVGAGTAAADYEGREVRGRVVLASGPVHRVHEAAVVERGAAGIVTDHRRLLPPVRTAAVDRDAIAYTSFWWSERSPRGWGFVVSPAAADGLRRRLDAGERLELAVDLRTRAFDTRVPLVETVIGEPSAREILILAHLCHPRPGANDNASGAAAALEAALALEALRASRSWRGAARAVRFLWMPEWNGTLAWLAADPERVARLDAALNLDMVGEDQAQCGSTLQLEHPPHWCASFAEPLVAALRDEWLGAVEPARRPRIAEVPYAGGSDHAVLVDPPAGVPCPMLIQWPDRYYHSSLDTPERCDPESLALAAGVAAAYALVLAEPGAGAALRPLVEGGAEARIAAQPEGLVREREIARAAGARASLSRLDPAPAAPEPRAVAPTGPVPRRLSSAPLDLLPHLMPGWDDVPAAARRAWHELERAIPGGRLTLELAWSACDGRRSLAGIAERIAVESGVRPAATGLVSLDSFFELAADLGIAAREARG